jgi:hypothetical protein
MVSYLTQADYLIILKAIILPNQDEVLVLVKNNGVFSLALTLFS